MGRFFASLFFFSFLLNFVWEVTQTPLYSSMGMGAREFSQFIAIHWEVSLGDALIILVAYLIVSVIFRNKRWPLERILAPWLLFVIGLLIWQIAVEYFAVYAWHRWEYSALMPTIFGIGFSPLLQMLILPLIAILLSRKQLEE